MLYNMIRKTETGIVSLFFNILIYYVEQESWLKMSLKVIDTANTMFTDIVILRINFIFFFKSK